MKKEISLVYSIGISMAVLFGGGYWLDQKFQTGYWWTIIGGVSGLSYTIWEIYKLATKEKDK